MQNTHWKIADLPWDQFDPSKVDVDLLAVAKAASLVEYNAPDYARYLANVFPGDAAFHHAMQGWATEEVQHGAALGQWAERADPNFQLRQSQRALQRRFPHRYETPKARSADRARAS